MFPASNLTSFWERGESSKQHGHTRYHVPSYLGLGRVPGTVSVQLGFNSLEDRADAT